LIGASERWAGARGAGPSEAEAKRRRRPAARAARRLDDHLFTQGQAAILDALNEAVSRLHAYEEAGDGGDAEVA
jgi:2-methylisocitrate lyase-like PEP mutase family enzyme